MKKSIIIEVIWVIGSLIAALLLFAFIPNSNSLDINLHDTYIVGSGFGQHLSLISLAFTYFITLSFCVYLIRVLYFEFKAISTNIIFLMITCLALYFLSDIIFILHPPVFETPTSNSTVKGLFYGRSHSYSAFGLPHIIKILLMLILAFTAFMIGRNWSRGMTK